MEKLRRLNVWTLVAVTILPVYLAAFLVLRPDIEPKTWEPGEIASHLLAGDGFSLHRFSGSPQPSANQEPVYPLLMAFFLGWVPVPYVALSVLQVLLWVAASVVLARLAHRLVGAPEKPTALIVALWPPSMVYVLMYHPLSLRTATLVFALAAAMAYRSRPGWRRALGLGVVLGAAALVRATFLILPFLILPWLVPAGSAGRRRSFALQFAFVLAVAGLIHSPWPIRNRIVLGAWVPGTTTAGYIALIGNRADATGALDGEALQRTYNDIPARFWQQPETTRDEALKKRVLAFWRDHPGEALLLYLEKLLFFWTWRPGVGGLYPRTWTLAYILLWCVSLPAILIGWRRARNNTEAEAPGLFLWITVAYSLLYALFAVNMRYRFETEPLLVPYGVVAAAALWERVTSLRRSQ